MAETEHVYKAWAAVSAELSTIGVGKDGFNDQQRYRFRAIDDVFDALSPAMAKHKLMVVVRVEDCALSDAGKTSKGTAQTRALVTAHYTLVSGVDGSTVEGFVFRGEGVDSGDKAVNKAMSAAYKYFAFQTFTIPLRGAMADGDNDSPEAGPPSAPNAPAKPPAPQAVVVTYGPDKGKRIEHATVEGLDLWANQAQAVIANKEQSHHHARAASVLAAIEAEMARRGAEKAL